MFFVSVLMLTLFCSVFVNVFASAWSFRAGWVLDKGPISNHWGTCGSWARAH